MRKQYHFQKSRHGFFAWDVAMLIEKSRDLPINEIFISEIKDFDSNYWYRNDTDIPTCKSITEHIKLIRECDSSFPIILAADGSIMDGMHRVCKSYLENREKVLAVRFIKTPKATFEDVLPEDLPY